MRTIVRFQSFLSAPGAPAAKLTDTASEGVRQRRNPRTEADGYFGASLNPGNLS